LSNHTAQADRIREMQAAASQQQRPGLHVLVAPTRRLLGCSDLAVALQKASAEPGSPARPHGDVVPESEFANSNTRFDEMAFQLLDLCTLARPIDAGERNEYRSQKLLLAKN
jgi:hypothetical protein